MYTVDGEGTASWLETFMNHPKVGSILGWPPSVLPMLQPPLRSLPVPAIAMALDVEELQLCDRRV